MDDKRLYTTILELSFDIERLLHYKVIGLFYHFHRNSFNDKVVTPYMISFTDNNNQKHNFLFDDIVNDLKYIPTYSIDKNISTELGYIDINNRMFVVNKANSIYKSLIEYYNQSNIQNNSQPIDKNIIDDIRNILIDSGFNVVDNKDYLIVEQNLYITKYTSFNDTNKEYIIRPNNIEEYDGQVCIGQFCKYCNENINECDLALINECQKCQTINIINYNKHNQTCRKCKNNIDYC